MGIEVVAAIEALGAVLPLAEKSDRLSRGTAVHDARR
jgi:hypothetical protein